ncbi:PTS sugar transporter subunit IIB [Pectinatus sottacetonis]|uniref:PTS sugar transporter subunit IIB n=1 Tax=Pectinatus sottacetonis TaxID=1002795 RepID=UPI001E364954|nr:PTS sugar transporter subunit IIB [Pectinatus sottacetonis]
MKNILLVCLSGMSTSLLVQKMEKAAEKNDITVRIWAVSEAEAHNNFAEADIVLLGPQLKFKYKEYKKMLGEKPVEVISIADYGRMQGEKVLKWALSILG